MSFVDGKESPTHSTLEDSEDLFVQDQWKRRYHFKISSFLVPTGIAFEAIEVTDDDVPGYRFNHLTEIDADYEEAENYFLSKIRKGLNRRHLKKDGSGWQIGQRGILRGRIDWNENFEDTALDKVLVIDGKRITVEEFGHMLEMYEGWQFKFKIIDPFEDD